MSLLSGPRAAAPALLLAAALASPGRADVPRLEQYATVGLTDLQATVKVVEADQTALDKINRDFGMAYRLKDVVVQYKEPGKLRMESRVGVVIFNGPTRYFRVPQLKFTRKDDLGESPGRQHSLLDVGILTRDSLTTLQSRYLRDEAVDGVETRVFEANYKKDDARYRFWVDPRTRLVLKREWYDSGGALRATFLYQRAREVKPGLWAPTRLEIRNGAGEVAGVTDYSDVRVNQGLDDALFQIS